MRQEQEEVNKKNRFYYRVIKQRTIGLQFILDILLTFSFQPLLLFSWLKYLAKPIQAQLMTICIY